MLGSCPLLVDNLIFVAVYFPEELTKEIAKYDYLTVLPINNYYYTHDLGEDCIKQGIRDIIAEAKRQNKIVVASSTPYYLNDINYLEFSLLYKRFEVEEMPEKHDFHLYSTEEMRYAFDWLNDDDLVEEIVVINTHKIADMCDDFEYVDETYRAPYIEDAYNKLEKIVYDKTHEIYGNNLDRSVEYRLSKELDNIKNNDDASVYMLHYYINEEAKKEGYINGARGSIGATLIGFLLGITKCNPLPSHYVCPKCHKVVWNDTVVDGFDAEAKNCSECGTLMKSDGHNIPYETFMGRDGERLPDIDLNVAPEFRENVVDVINKVAPNNKAYRAGTTNTISHREAVKMVNDFAGEGEEVMDYDLKEQMVTNIQNVADKQGLHPGGFIIVPDGIDINDYTPLTKVDDVICTQNDYHTISEYFYKADILSHVDQRCFKFFKDNGLDFNEIDILDPKVMELFNPDNELEYDYAGIPEFGYGGNDKAKEIIELVKPKKFSDLVKISTLMHGTNTWNNNGKVLFEQGIALDDLLGSRDDVFDTLIKYGIDRAVAYEVMENVRKGKDLVEEQTSLLLENNLPHWFIKSCNTIKYMFPKAHAIEYVINTLMIAWVKIYKPALFYASYFNFRTDSYELDTMCKSFKEIDERIMKLVEEGNGNSNLADTLYIAGEMEKRGINLINQGVKDEDENKIFVVNPINELDIICKKL